LVLTLPWIMTKNLWVSTGAHVLNDWLLMAMGLLGTMLASQT
jgi:membrane protease YdiL (CAAX protease family)